MHLHLSFLGSFQAQLDGESVSGFRSDKVRGLLAYLAVETDRPHRREELATLLWGDYPDRSARTNLRMSLSNLRKILRPLVSDGPAEAEDAGGEMPVFTITRQQVTFHTGSAAWVDVHAFSAHLDFCQQHPHQELAPCLICAQRLEEAADLYQGDFLAGLSPMESQAFGEWRRRIQERLHQRALTALHTLTVHYLARRDFARAETFARRQLAFSPWYEEAHRQLIQALAAAGQRAEALAQYEACRALLEAELGVPPSAETEALYQQVKQGESVNMVEVRAAVSSSAASTPHNLPPQITPFLGRQAELAELRKRLLDPVHRLLTIAGAGGAGKTRLALAVAEQILAPFPDGVWFVSLIETQQDGERVPAALQNRMATTIASTLDMTFQGAADPKTQLLNHLRPRQMLLILDNIEHLLQENSVATTEFLLRILREAPEVSLLITSRRRLGLQAEYVLQLEGLPVTANGNLQEVRRSPGVQLFIERAERSPGGFTPTQEELPHIVRLCRFVSGLPLAIELAATWVTHYSCVEIVPAMQENLDFLATPMADLPARHRSMRAVFEESWRLLSHRERSVLAQASIFRGGFSREAALSVTGATVQILTSLVDRSLLRRTAAGRYELHGLLHQFAMEKRRVMSEDVVSDELEKRALAARHSAFYLTFLQEREEAVNSRRSRQTLAEIRQDFGNVRKAWGWAVAQGAVEQVQASLKALSRYYTFTGLFQEGESVFHAAAARMAQQAAENKAGSDAEENLPDLRRLRGKLLVEQAHLLTQQGKYDAAITVARAAIRLAEETGDAESQVLAHVHMGHAHWRQGDLSVMRAELEQALALARNASLAALEAYVLSRFGALALTHSQYEQARAYLEQYLHFCQREGDRQGEAIAYNNLGYLYHACYDYGKARLYFERSRAIKQEMGVTRGEGMTVVNLGAVYLNLGDYDRARVHYRQALTISREIDDRRLEGLVLSNLALLHHRQGDDARAQERGRQALRLTQEVGDRLTQGYVLTHLGHALAARKEWKEAAQAYRQTIELRQKTDPSNTFLEPIAGLAHVHLAQGRPRQALEIVEEILPQLMEGVVQGLFEPFRLYLTCYRVLAAAQDPRAHAVLATAQRLLQTSAAKIEDETLRRSFLENVAIHREIAETAHSLG